MYRKTIGTNLNSQAGRQCKICKLINTVLYNTISLMEAEGEGGKGVRESQPVSICDRRREGREKERKERKMLSVKNVNGQIIIHSKNIVC